MLYIHKLSDVQSNQIGEGTKNWQFSVVMENACIGKNCNINAHCFIENDLIMGDCVTVKSGVYLWDGVRVSDDVFIRPNVTITNDKYPRSKKYPDAFLKTVIEERASIVAASTLLGGITIGAKAMIVAGSVGTNSVPEGEVWYGNPAKRMILNP